MSAPKPANHLDMKSLPPAYIIAGGRSRRFPGDKALALINSQPQLVQLAGQLQHQGHQVFIVADRSDRYQRLGISCLTDMYAETGPLGGLVTGLYDRLRRQGPGWILLVSCDQLLWKNDWLLDMQPLWQGQNHCCEQALPQFSIGLWAESNATAGEFHHREPQAMPLNPIPGLYHTDLTPLLESMISHSRLAMREVVKESLERCYFSTTPEPPTKFAFNTPEQLDQLLPALQAGR